MELRGYSKDPAGQMIQKDGHWVREINPSFLEQYDYLQKSGIYDNLFNNGLLPFKELSRDRFSIQLLPEQIPFIVSPEELCFERLKQSALLTLRLTMDAINLGAITKDADANNVQWINGKPVFVDTLSFIRYKEDMPWYAYGQFVRHYLLPLLLAQVYGGQILKMLGSFPDGIPLELGRKLLPNSSYFSLNPLVHLHMTRLAVPSVKEVKMTKLQNMAILSSLEDWIGEMHYKIGMGWVDYKVDKEKFSLVRDMAGHYSPGIMLDVGANLGDYSLLGRELGYKTISVDSDHDCVNVMATSKTSIPYPLVVDVSNASAFWERLGKVRVIMGLAVIHHLCVTCQLPIQKVVSLFAKHCEVLILEWVSPEDEKFKLIADNKDVHPYTEDVFRAVAFQHFKEVKCKRLNDTRAIYVMRFPRSWDSL